MGRPARPVLGKAIPDGHRQLTANDLRLFFLARPGYSQAFRVEKRFALHGSSFPKTADDHGQICGSDRPGR